MKRLSCILFLAILLFNLYGYRLMLDCIQDRESRSLEAKLDRQQYNDDELISIKTALNLPYYTSSDAYERAYGSVNVNGVEYEYVKRRVLHDTLELLCLPNRTSTELQSVKNEFFKLSFSEQPSQSNKKAPGIVKISLPDYFQEMGTNTSRFFPSIQRTYCYTPKGSLPEGHKAGPYHPPCSMPAAV